MFQRVLFATLVLYAWALAMFLDPSSQLALRGDDDGDGAAIYVMTVAPAVLLIGAGMFQFASLRFDKPAIVLLFLTAIVAVVSIARGDGATLLSVGALCLVLVAIRQSSVRVTCGFVNGLMLLSIITTEILFLVGIGKYGVISGQAVDDLVPWRASMFAFTVTNSWLFALVVIAMNYFHNHAPGYRRIMITLGLYFVVASASRTGLIVLTLCVAFLGLARFAEFRSRLLYKLFIPFAVAVFVASLNAEAILMLLSGINDPLLNAILFKSAEGVAGVEQVSTSVLRTFIWTQHLQLFSESPLVGQGTFDLLSTAPEFERMASTGTESFLTALFARIGIPAALFVYFMYRLSVDAAERRDRLAYCLMILFSITTLAYGSYIVPYDFVFLVLFGAMNYSRSRRELMAFRKPTVKDNHPETAILPPPANGN